MKKYYIGALISGVLCVVCFLVYAAYDNESVELPVIMYHSILKDGARIGKYVVSPAELEEDFKYLSDNGYESVTVNDLIDYVDFGKPLPEKPVMITFDDGYYNNYVYAEPILQKYGMRAVVSVVGQYVDLYSETGEHNPSYSYVSWEDIQKMHNSGIFEIQNHSYDMHTITQSRSGSKISKGESEEAYNKRFCNDAVKMQNLLTDAGVTSSCYTYPYGIYCDESEEYIRELGFRASLSCNEGINSISRDPECLYLLKRYNRAGEEKTEGFFSKVLK